MTVESRKCNNKINFQLLFVLFLVLFSEVLLVYTTYILTKSNCLNSCSEDEIWKIINNEKFSGLIQEKVEKSLREIQKKQKVFLNTEENVDTIITRTRREHEPDTDTDPNHQSLKCPNGLPDPPGQPDLKGDYALSGNPGLMKPSEPKSKCRSSNPDIELPIKVSKYGSEVYPDLSPKHIDNIIKNIGELKTYSIPNNRIPLRHLSESSDLIWEARDTDKTYSLFYGFDKGNKVIYNNRFYHRCPTNDYPAIISFSLTGGGAHEILIHELLIDRLEPLYKSNDRYLDFNADENGLWVIFAVENSKNTGIIKVNTDTKTIRNAWNITIDHTKYDEMFIASGILYTLEASENLKITSALDLYSKKIC